MADYYIPPSKNLPIDWMAKGNCRDSDPDDFYPERGDFYGVVNAKSVCRGCEVREECLEYALTQPYERWGVWGGLTEQERRPIRVRMGRSANQTRGASRIA